MKKLMQRPGKGTLTLKLTAILLAISSALVSPVLSATTLNDIFEVAQQMNGQSSKSQAKIDSLTEETRQLLGDYKIVLKEIEGLRVYNRQLPSSSAKLRRLCCA
jgi:hypothetical protein